VDYAKVKSVAKHVEVEGPELDRVVLSTMAKIAKAVGGTLGPGGKTSLIERYEHALPPFLTKDGVTVFRALGFKNPIAHCVMEMARDASVKTANEAGDGTTTATILSEAIVRLMKEFCSKNRRVSPQWVVRQLEKTFRDVVEPAVRALSRKVDLETDLALLRAVAQVSANGDVELADAVMKCFEYAGDQGNVTIVEVSGPSKYEVEHVQGFTVNMGYERSCAKMYPKFINDPGTQRCVMENPVFLLYNGKINEFQHLMYVMEQVLAAESRPQDFGLKKPFPSNVVVVATGFSENVIANMAMNFSEARGMNIFPLVVPNDSPQSSAQLEFLRDLAGVTGAVILDQVSKPLQKAELADLGVGCSLFECTRYRSNIVGFSDEGALMLRVGEVEQQLKNPESELDRQLLQERLAKLSGGLARLKVFGSSNGETKEKRDRADDAVCAVRGAIKHGCLPGGAWTLLKLCDERVLPSNVVNDEILRPAFMAPIMRLIENSGIVEDSPQVAAVIDPIVKAIAEDKVKVYDFLENKHVDPYEGGILDSTPAVLEAIRNAVSIASQLGSLGSCVVFERDQELERSEARASAQWARDVSENPADDRP
jgi:chaperonin GroEL